MADKDVLKDQESEHIGTAAHPKRNLLIGVGVLVVGGLIGFSYWRGGQSSDAAMAELGRFRQEMATQCKSEQFARPAQAGLDRLYAESSRMQAVVMEQSGALKRGQANCDQILRALKSVDYPIE